VVVLLIVLPPALWFWVQPSLQQSGILAVMAVIFTAGMWLMTSALRLGETSALAPLHYLRLLMMAVAGWFIYAEVPSLSTLFGAVLVLGAASYTISRNASKRVPQLPTPTAP
jgi:drug/metabolite transporter (DMT)-like permease